MKFSESWLRTFVNPTLSSTELSHLLTMAGLEVEEEETVAPAFDNVVVAQVLEVVKHPDADRLNVCKVDLGNGNIQQIVCGAPNVASGLKVPCAQPGALLPGDFKIKVAKVRGVESSGMLCSAKELGISEEASGLLILPESAPVGTNLREYLDLDDTLLTLKLTPNRADCLSLTGIAREVAALTGAPLSPVDVKPSTVTGTLTRAVTLEAPEACPLYCGRIISNVNAKAPTPDWMKRRLERSGLRSISALVDITNYVLLEMGQPLHAFDNKLLNGTIRARFAAAGEKLELLNDQIAELSEDILVIADDERALAMAGIMGGKYSSISLETTEVFMESAYFAPKAVAGRARRYSFSTDSSHRFERGVDFGNTINALERATELVLEICGGEACPVTTAASSLPARPAVLLRPSRVAKVLGISFTNEKILEFLTLLGLHVESTTDGFLVTPPSYRFDIEIEIDLIEEIARLHGYDNIPAPAPKATISMLPQTESSRPLYKVRQILADRGFQEVVNYAFIDEAWERDFAENSAPIKLANPIASHMSVMRSTLIGGLIQNVQTNLKRRQSRVRVFETGRCFSRATEGAPVSGFNQPWKLAALAYGPALPEQWGCPTRNVDYYDIKGDLEALLAPLKPRFDRRTHPAFHPGRSAVILLGDKEIGVIGELHPKWLHDYDLPCSPVIFEVDLSVLESALLPQYSEVSKLPPSIRDLAIVADQCTPVQEILEALMANKPEIVKEIRLFDVYAGKGVEEGKKSLALRITMQDTQKTLQDTEVESATLQLVNFLEKTFNATLRV